MPFEKQTISDLTLSVYKTDKSYYLEMDKTQDVEKLQAVIKQLERQNEKLRNRGNISGDNLDIATPPRSRNNTKEFKGMLDFI